jgi:hypothetical protein
VDRIGHRVEVAVLHRHQLVVGLEVLLRRGRLVAVPVVGAVLATHVDRAHAGERLGPGGRRRVVPRNPVDLDVDAGPVEDVPEGDAAAIVDEFVSSKRDRVAKQLDAGNRLVARRPRRRRERLVGLGIPVDEVEHAVAPGVAPGDEVRPGHRALRGRAGSERLIGPLLRQAREVRHAPFAHQPVEDHRIHAVDAQDEDPRRRGFRGGGRRRGGRGGERAATEQEEERQCPARHFRPPFGQSPAPGPAARAVLPGRLPTG